jgi:hypothetical protein
MTSGDTLAVDETSTTADPREPLGSLFRDLRTSASGLSGREAQRRLLVVWAQMSSRILRADSGRTPTQSRVVDRSCSRRRISH